MPLDFQRQFPDKGYPKFSYFEHWIFKWVLKIINKHQNQINSTYILYVKKFILLKRTLKFSNLSSKYKSFLMSSTKLEGGLQSILGSFGHFLFTNINLSKVFDYKWYLLNFVSIPTKEKLFSISICDSTISKICPTKKSRIENMASCFAHHWKGTWFPWNPLGNAWISTFPYWHVL